MLTLRVGTRGSKLARVQTNQVILRLQEYHPDITFEEVIISTTGDTRQNVPFAEVGTKGMFVKELEEALLCKEVDFAVHSMKDLPGVLSDGLCIAATPRRADARDTLISRGATLTDLSSGATVGTGSARRQVQLLAQRNDLVFVELRGNLDTRLRHLDEGKFDAIILASAGMERLGYADRITCRLPVEICVPAPGQGALALEARSENKRVREILASINDEQTELATTAERAYQAKLNAGCTVPAGAYARIVGQAIELIAMLAEPDGSRIRKITSTAPVSEAFTLGDSTAKRMLED